MDQVTKIKLVAFAFFFSLLLRNNAIESLCLLIYKITTKPTWPATFRSKAVQLLDWALAHKK